MTDAGYEKRDASARSVWIFGAGLAVALAVSMVVTGVFLWWLAHHPPSPVRASRIAEPGLTPRGPVVVELSRGELAHYLAQQRDLLSSYGWIDRGNGIVRIPIERAMELVADRGTAAVVAGPGQPPPSPRTPVEMQEQKAVEGAP